MKQLHYTSTSMKMIHKTGYFKFMLSECDSDDEMEGVVPSDVTLVVYVDGVAFGFGFTNTTPSMTSFSGI